MLFQCTVEAVWSLPWLSTRCLLHKIQVGSCYTPWSYVPRLKKTPKAKKKQLMLSLKSAFEKPMWNRVGCIHLSCTAYDLKSSLTFPSIKNSPSILKVQYVKYHRCTGEKFSFLLFPMQMHIASYFGLCKTNISYCHSCVVSVGCLLFISDRVYVSLNQINNMHSQQHSGISITQWWILTSCTNELLKKN